MIDTRNVVQINRVTKSFGADVVLRDVSLEIDQSQVVTILGPSGAGKSTLLRCINGIEEIDSGSIFVDGNLMGYELKRDGSIKRRTEREAARQRRGIGMVFQKFNLFPHMTALENIIEAPIATRLESRREATGRARELLERVGLRDKADSYPAQLSGGQAQRVAIARALAMRPKLMLFDEATSALDPSLVGEVLQIIADLAKQGMTMLIVTHEFNFARSVSDRIVVMERGSVIDQGSPREIFDPARISLARSFLASEALAASREA